MGGCIIYCDGFGRKTLGRENRVLIRIDKVSEQHFFFFFFVGFLTLNQEHLFTLRYTFIEFQEDAI